tara:strand:- start:18774 stop:21281 length:2508 start_codon:yes stop_codon:yes gene_type:complete
MSNVVLVKDTSNNFVPLKVDSNGALQCNVADVELHAGDISVAVDGLEALQGTNNTTTASIDTRMDSIIGATNNTASMGEGQSQLKAICLGYDRSGGKARSILVDSGGIVATHDTVAESSLDAILAKNTEIESTADLILAKNTEVESSLNSLITANHSDLIALEATSELILAKNTEIESTADSILAKNTEVESSLNSLITANHSDLIALEATSELILAKNTEIESTADAILAKNTELESTADSILAKNTEIESTADAILAKNTEIETELGLIKQAVQLLDNALDGNYLNVNANIGGADFAVNSGNKDTATQRVVIATDDIPTGLTNTILNAVNGSIGTGNTALGAIKTAVELLDNVVDGNYLNVNANIGGADFAVNSGNKDSATQRVVIATDDVPFTTLNTHLSEIEDAVETLQACVDSNKVKVQFEAGDLNIGNVDVVSSVLPSGASTESTLGSMSAKLPATLGQKANANCISTCRSSTAGAYDMSGRTTIATASTTTKLLCDSAGHLQVDVVSGGGSTDVSGLSTHAKQDTIIGHVNGIEGLIGTTNSGLSSIDSGITDIDGLITDGNALLTTIDSDTSAIKTAVQLLDNALDGNYFNVNQNIAGTDVSSNSGNKDAQTQRVVIATDDIPIALVNSNLGAIKTAVQLLDNALDGNYFNVNQNIAGTDVSSNSGNKDAQTQRVVIATDDIPIALVNTNLVAIETTADAILAKNTELETLLTSISQRTATGTLSTATNLADGGALAIVDTAGYRYMTIFGKATNDVDLYIQYSLTNSAGAMISLYNETPYKLQSVSAINNITTFNTTIEHMARYVRFINFSGNQINALTLYYQLSN